MRTEIGNSTWKAALEDFKGGLSHREYCFYLGWEDVKLRYRRSVLGPLWLTFGMAMLATSMAFVWSTLFNMELGDLFPYLTCGLIIWNYISAMMVDSCNTFVAQTGVITSVRLPLSAHVFRSCFSGFIGFAHQIPIYVVVALIFGVPFNFNTLLSFVGLVLLILNAVWMSFLMGVVGTRYRDFQPILTSFLPLIFLLTPIVWKAEMLGDRAAIAYFNPFTHFIGIVREPLLGGVPSLESYLVVLTMTITGIGLACYVFIRYRARVVYWL